MPNAVDEIRDLINLRIEALRPRLLDLGRRNPLVSTKLSARSSSCVRIVDELPDVLFFNLNTDQDMRFVPLPSMDDDPRDEESHAFREALAETRLTDAGYIADIGRLDSNSDDYLDQTRAIERALKDRIRARLGLPARLEKQEANLAQHARNNGVAPSYDLPSPVSEDDNERHFDLDIQMLFLPKDLERKLSALGSKCNTWIQETGINVLHGAFGFLEWCEPGSTETAFAPLILLQVKFEKRKTKQGYEFWVKGLGEQPEINTVFVEKLRREFGIELPPFAGGSVESYLQEVAAITPKSLSWRVKRQVAFGVFPSARIAMYRDLNTQGADFAGNEIIRPLFGGSESAGSSPFADEYVVDEPEIERKVPCLVQDADASQFSTLVDIASGKNVAVEGPPGTGKSQTIVNTIAAALAAGKKVLFVAEKSAALDVVRSRLDAIGLGEFLLPLQAERSTREKVIGSIRERLEMDAGRPPQNYERLIADFRAVRDEAALYVATLCAEFDGSGLTIHEVLGKSIATSERLASLPKPLQMASFPVDQAATNSAIAEIARKATLLHEAWAKAAACSPLWKGLRVTTMSRFNAEEISELAKQLAHGLEAIDDASRKLGALGLAVKPAPDGLATLIAVFDKASAAIPEKHAVIAAKVAAADGSASLKEFISSQALLETLDSDLKQIFSEEISPGALEAVSELASICSEHSIEDFDPNALTESLGRRRKTIDALHTLMAQMRPFATQVPDSEHWRFSDIGKMRRLVARAGRNVLYLRAPALADPEALIHLRRLNETGRQLRREWQALSPSFVIAEVFTVERLQDSVAALRNGGFFRIFRADYRRAKALYSRLATAPFRREEAAALLQRLIVWMEQEHRFRHDGLAATLYGAHFRGIETDFDLFDGIVQYYDGARDSFSSLEGKPLQDFLLTGDGELLMRVPELLTYPETLCLRAIEDGIEAIETEASAREAAYERVRELAKMFLPTAAIKANSLGALQTKLSEALSLKRRLDDNTHISAWFGEDFNGRRTDTRVAEAVAILAETIGSLGAERQAAAGVIATGKTKDCLTPLKAMQSALALSENLERELSARTGLDACSALQTGSLAERSENLRTAADDHESLYAHAEFARAKAEVHPALHGLVKAYAEAMGSYEGLGAALETLAWRALAKRCFEKHGNILSKFPGTKLAELRKRIAELDRSIIAASRLALRASLKTCAQPPRGCGTGRTSEYSELSLIEHETKKKQRFIPVRDLTRRAGRALMELKPCWMMSPLAVAQYLPRGAHAFDLCIIDEASQMTPEDAIGALARSRQAMIVGDTNQLPPSNFFRKILDDDEADEDETVLSESVLEMANGAFRPARRLRWHYRSRHSGLIQFSNRMVYNDDLVVFPSATESKRGMGVEFRAVAGLYKAGTNAVEARAMVEATISFMKADPDRSLGVVTLNQKQRDLIFEEMEYALSRDPLAARYVEDWSQRNDGLEQFFVKNLENVQGDERDVIFIGTVYGPEQHGARVMQRFGPINGAAGKRRLNVLFSRAKQLVVTFSSMKSADILAEENGNEGAYMLKRWLEYAATGTLETGEPPPEPEPDSDFEIHVIQQIRAMGCIAVPQVGVRGYSIDIGVKHPQWEHGFILGVECDGAAYHSSKSARDRDRLRQEVLEGLGWHFHRIWSTDWFNNPSKQAGILRQVIEDRLVELRAKESDFTVRPERHPSVAERPSSAVAPPEATARPEKVAATTTAGIGADVTRVSVGDTVRVRYLTDDKRIVQFTISRDQSDASNGVIHCDKPIAKALLGAEEGDEVEVLIGSYLRPAVLEKIVSRAG